MDVLQHDMENYVESSKEGELKLFIAFAETWKEETAKKEEWDYRFFIDPLPIVLPDKISFCDVNYTSRLHRKFLPWHFDYPNLLRRYSALLPALLSYPTTEAAGVFESERFVCRIVAVDEKQVTADVIVEKDVFQTRKFDVAPLRGEIKLEPGEVFTLLIQTKQGERRFVYREASEADKVILANQTGKDLFSKYADSPFFKPAPGNDQDDF